MLYIIHFFSLLLRAGYDDDDDETGRGIRKKFKKNKKPLIALLYPLGSLSHTTISSTFFFGLTTVNHQLSENLE
jgi:hypothetical protein